MGSSVLWDDSGTGLPDDIREIIASTDIENVKQDVLPYIDPNQLSSLDIWSNDYFLQLVDMMKVQ